MGGAGVHYWQPIADFYKIDLSVLNTQVDPCFRFMTRDWDGQIRMDLSSSYAMQSLIKKSQQHDISFACDTDHDRHGIVTKSSGLMPANHYLSAAIYYLFKHRPLWSANLKIGKTLVSSQMIDRVADLLTHKFTKSRSVLNGLLTDFYKGIWDSPKKKVLGRHFLKKTEACGQRTKTALRRPFYRLK